MYFKNIVFNLSDIRQIITCKKSFLKELNKFLQDNKINLYFISSSLNNTINYKEFSFLKIPKENIFFVNEEYLLSLSEIDRELRKENSLKDINYNDEYFKVYVLNKLKPKLNFSKTLFIGTDIWTDAYYLTEYTKVNVLLLKSHITFNKKPYLKDLKTIPTINLNIEEFKQFLEKKQKFDYSQLKSFAKNYLYRETIGKINLNIDFNKIIKR